MQLNRHTVVKLSLAWAGCRESRVVTRCDANGSDTRACCIEAATGSSDLDVTINMLTVIEQSLQLMWTSERTAVRTVTPATLRNARRVRNEPRLSVHSRLHHAKRSAIRRAAIAMIGFLINSTKYF